MELKEIKNKFKDSHAARMAVLNAAIESLEKTQKPESPEPKETKNGKTLSKLNDLLASL